MPKKTQKKYTHKSWVHFFCLNFTLIEWDIFISIKARRFRCGHCCIWYWILGRWRCGLLCWLRILRNISIRTAVSKICFFYNDLCSVDSTSLLIYIGAGLNTAADTNLTSFCDVFLNKLGGLAECYAVDKVPLPPAAVLISGSLVSLPIKIVLFIIDSPFLYFIIL